MAFGIGNIPKIIEDFKESFNQIFGLSRSVASKMDRIGLDNAKYGGIVYFDAKKWVGNTKGKKVRYGFAIFDSTAMKAGMNNDPRIPAIYYLDIPPQNITQKEIFATNISATRRGIIVESEGVVFKDVIIQGTTGIFPASRGGSNVNQSNFFNSKSVTSAPQAPAGVNEDGLSTASNVNTVSGYEEFLSLRQYFLRYANEKISTNGDRFLLFINEKDNQTLIVEPLEFTMERSSKSPLTYNYKIVLKAIGNLDTVFAGLSEEDKSNILEKIGNVFANVSAGIGQVRAVINQGSSTIQKTFQAIDQTINGPLRQVQFALQDLSEGISTVMSLPTILIRNTSSAILGIRENIGTIGNQLGFNNSADTKTNASQIVFSEAVINKIQSDPRITVPRAFVNDTKIAMKAHADNLADAVNMGDPVYDQIKGRTPTSIPSPTKVVEDSEFLLLGSIHGLTSNLNTVLASNDAFEADAEQIFDNTKKAFELPNVPEEQQFLDIRKPNTVKQVKIKRNDTLERIALRELGQTLRWPELVILNNLKPPYINEDGGDHVKKYGDTLLVGVD